MNPIPKNRPPSVFRSAPDVHKASNTLLRVMTLHSELPPRAVIRNKIVSGTNSVCNEAKNNLPSIEQAKATLNKDLSTSILKIYGQEIELANTADMVDRCINQIIKDINSIPATPLVKSNDGQNGPTLLVAYPRLSNKTSEVTIKSYVIKWTDQNELCCNRLYSTFSRFIQDKYNSISFEVPLVCGFNFETNIHELSDTSLCQMQGDDGEKIRNTFNAIAKIGAPKHPMPNKIVMLAERINGETLCSFVMAKYKMLTNDQKEKLFIQLGQIAMLDLIIGNSDRLLPICKPTENESYHLLGSEANLGNIMIRWIPDEKKDPLIYAIDNAIEAELINDPILIQKHLAFLESQFSNPEMADTLSKSIARSILSAISNHIDQAEKQKIPEFRKEFNSISTDIEQFGTSCFQAGLKGMSSMLESTLIPMWNGEQGNFPKNYLSTTYPKLLSAIEIRFKEFTTMRTP